MHVKLLCISEVLPSLMCPEAASNDDHGSKEVKDRRARATSTVYTVDAAPKTPMDCVTINFCDDQSPLSTLNNAGRQKNAAAAAAAWRYHSAVQSDVHGRASPLHGATTNRRPANKECLRRSETCSPAEVIIHPQINTCCKSLSFRCGSGPQRTHVGPQRIATNSLMTLV